MLLRCVFHCLSHVGPQDTRFAGFIYFLPVRISGPRLLGHVALQHAVAFLMEQPFTNFTGQSIMLPIPPTDVHTLLRACIYYSTRTCQAQVSCITPTIHDFSPMVQTMPLLRLYLMKHPLRHLPVMSFPSNKSGTSLHPEAFFSRDYSLYNIY